MGCEFIRVVEPPTAYEVHSKTKQAMRDGEPFPCAVQPSVHASHEEILRGAYKEIKVELASVCSQGFGNMREITGITDEGRTIRIQADRSRKECAMGTVEDTPGQDIGIECD